MDIFEIAHALADEPFHTWLTKKGMTARSAAKKLKVTPDYLSMIRRRDRRPSPDLLRKMAKLSRLSYDRLAEWHRLDGYEPEKPAATKRPKTAAAA